MLRTSRRGPVDYLNVDRVTKNLERRSVSGGLVVFSGNGLRLLMQLGLWVLLARMLTPDDFGVMAMVAPVTSFLMIFNTMGLSTYTIQRPVVSQEEVSALFWINLGMSLLMTLIVIAVAPLLSILYGDPRVMAVTMGLASTFLLQGLVNQHNALLVRQMQFGTTAAIDLVSVAASLVAGLSTAALGWGYWAIVTAQVTTPTVSLMLTWALVHWRPSYPSGSATLRRALSFGSNLTGFQLVNHFGRNADNVLIGWRLGSTELGYYSMSYRLLMLPSQTIVQPLGTVAVPALSRLATDPEAYRKYYKTSISLVVLLSFPLTVFALFMSPDLVVCLLGNEWLPASPIFSMLAVVALLHSIYVTMGWIYLSGGRTDRMFQWACIANPITLVAFVIGLHWGALGVAAGYAIVNALLFFPGLWFATRFSPIQLRDIVSAAARPSLLGVAVVPVLVVCRFAGVTEAPGLLRLSLALSGSLVAITLAVLLLYPLATIRARWQGLRLLLRKSES